MKNSKNPRTSSNLHQHLATNISESKYLPPEVWTQILSTLPAKTLLKFRCVCKSWCSIIDDPDFIHLHFQHFKINSGNNQSLVALDGLGSNNLDTLVRVPETLGNTSLIFMKYESCSYRITSSCNGLLLAVKHVPRSMECRLWNPCIRKSFILPTCPLNYCSYLLGYAPDSKDYKVAALVFDRSQDILPIKIQLAVYSLRDQLWTIRNPITARMLKHYSLSTAVFFRGAAYWLAQNDYQREDESTHLGFFDFDKENIDFLELPFSLDETGFCRFLFHLGESLAVFSISMVTSSIWVLQQGDGKEPWTLWFSGKSSWDAYQEFDLCYSVLQKAFYYETDGGYIVCGNNAYNIASCQLKKLEIRWSLYFDMEPYFESLVLSKGYGARDLRKFP